MELVFFITLIAFSFVPEHGHGKIPAIKALRDVLGFGLKETKTLAELIQVGTPIAIQVEARHGLQLALAGWRLREPARSDYRLFTAPMVKQGTDDVYLSLVEFMACRKDAVERVRREQEDSGCDSCAECDPLCDSASF